MKPDLKEFEIKHLGKQDEELLSKLIKLFNEVYKTKNTVIPKKSYLQNLLKTDRFIALVIVYKEKVIGGLTGYELPMYYTENTEMFIYDIAVKQEYQRKGVGKKLLIALKEYCKQNKIKEIFVAANKEDKHALDFYAGTGGKAEKVVHFNYKIKNT